MVDASVLTDEVRALIGKRTEPARVQVTRKSAEHASEVYLGHPVKIEEPDGSPAPGYVLAGLGSGDNESIRMPSLLPADLLISNEWTFERRLILGEWLVATQYLADISERFGGQFGYSLHVRSETEFADESGRLVAKSTNTMMQYDPKGAEGRE